MMGSAVTNAKYEVKVKLQGLEQSGRQGKKDILVTNNPMASIQYHSRFLIDFKDTNTLGILTRVRNLIHKGHRLLTHPLSGSIKPNETMYKSVLITGISGIPDPQSVTIIEESVLTAQKFQEKEIPEKYLHDMQVIDLALINDAIK